jgi:hypothetical protein
MDRTKARDTILAMVNEYAFEMAHKPNQIETYREEAWAALAEFGVNRQTVENRGK